MKTEIAINEKVVGIVRELEFGNVKELIRDTLSTEIICRISNFSEEVEHFEKKYGQKYVEFSKEYETGKEDFTQHCPVRRLHHLFLPLQGGGQEGDGVDLLNAMTI